MISLEVPNDRLDGLASLEQSALLIGQTLVLAAVLDINVRVVLVHTPVTLVCVHDLESDARALHQDAGVFNLLVQRVPVIRVAWKPSGTNDQVASERDGQPHLVAEFVGEAALALGNAFHLRGVPALELGASASIAASYIPRMTIRFLHTGWLPVPWIPA